ncbi:MAG TPA: tetratricopeptide repeat protein [Kofleriaceae bacterium]|nr:tetratricopeptide repeat protein [Kofleriaceae bacterium]
MSKKRRNDERGDSSPVSFDRVLALLDEAPAGLHDVEPPAARLPSGLPEPLIDFYARCDGARLFIDSVELVASAEVAPRGEHWQFGTLEGEDLLVDARGRVWRSDESLDDLVCEGTRLDRWLAGIVDAIGLLYDADGEFEEDVFDEDGELLAVVGERQLRAQLKRDPGAIAPRWRLGHALLAQGSTDEGRRELEEVVAREPGFAWGWLDLAKISERLGELPGAIDEARAAAEAAEAAEHPQAGYFHAQLARLAAVAKDEPTRALAARKAAQLAPDLKAAQLAGANESLTADDLASARGLLELLRAVWPRDLEVMDLARRLDAAEN